MNMKEESLDQIIDNMTLMDDDLFGLVFDENIPLTEYLLRTILQRDDIKVISVVGQRELRNPIVGGRNIRLDILAQDGAGHQYNCEVQRSNSGAVEKRARFHSSMIDSRMLKKGQDFKELNDSYVIFITEKDYFQKGLPIYTVNRYMKEVNKSFRDGSHIIYVNGSYKGKDKIGQLLQDFHCKRASEIQNRKLAESVRYYKEKGGRSSMCESVERYAERKAKQRAEQTLVEEALQFGIEKERIIARLREKFSLSEEQAKELFEQYAPA